MVALGGLVLLATSLAPNVSLDGLGGVDTVAAVTAVAGLTSYGAARQSARQLDRKMIA
jgi:hypothetical protein